MTSAAPAGTGDGPEAPDDGQPTGPGPLLRVKLCGLTRLSDARAAGRAGADLVGAILVPGSPRRVTTEAAAALGRTAGVPLALVVADLSARQAARAARTAGARVLQLHGAEPPELLAELRKHGDWELWKALRVRTSEEILEARERYGAVADLILLDAWHPTRLGGTGVSFPWHVLEAVRDRLVPPPALGVAGGLTPENVAEAVRRLGPALVDVSSGIEEAPGKKDPERMTAFVARAREEGRRRDHQEREREHG